LSFSDIVWDQAIDCSILTDWTGGSIADGWVSFSSRYNFLRYAPLTNNITFPFSIYFKIKTYSGAAYPNISNSIRRFDLAVADTEWAEYVIVCETEYIGKVYKSDGSKFVEILGLTNNAFVSSYGTGFFFYGGTLGRLWLSDVRYSFSNVVVDLMDNNVFFGGTGTEADPYLVGDADSLNAVRYGLTAHYKQIADIDFNGTPYSSGWTPIGKESNSNFSGVYDGNCKKINNLYINTTTDYAGLFRTVSGTVKNIIITNAYIKSTVNFVGALMGLPLVANIFNCSVIGEVYGKTNVGLILGGNGQCNIINCCSDGKVEGETNVGGLAGVVYGNGPSLIQNCYSRANVKATNLYPGGLIGCIYNNNVTINCCYSTGLVTGINPQGLLAYRSGGIITNSFWDTQTSGCATSNGGVGKTTAEMKDINTYLTAGWGVVSV